MEIVIAPLFVVIFIVVMVAAISQNKKNIAIWAQFAQDHGLVHMEGSWGSVGTISGTYEGYEIQISTFSRGSGKNRRTYTRIETSIRPTLISGLHIYRETPVFSSIGKFFGGQDIQTGDQHFDDVFIIKATDERAALELLSAPVRGALLDYNGLAGEFDLTADRLSYVTHGTLTDTARMEDVLNSQHEAVDALVRQSQRHLFDAV